MLNIECPIARQSSITIFLIHPVEACNFSKYTSREYVKQERQFLFNYRLFQAVNKAEDHHYLYGKIGKTFLTNME